MRSCAFRPGADAATESRQNMLRIEPEESLLIGTRRVKDQMVEAEIEVVADPLDMLVRIGRDDPAARGALGRKAIGEALHLFRTVDGNLFLWRQGENRPVARILHRALLIRVERNLDLDHARVVGRARASLGPPFRHLRQYRFGIELARLAAGADQAVAHSARIFRDQGAGRGDIDRYGSRRPIIDGRVLCAIILAFERHPLLGPELTHERDGLPQTREPLFELGPFHAGRRHLVQAIPRCRRRARSDWET